MALRAFHRLSAIYPSQAKGFDVKDCKDFLRTYSNHWKPFYVWPSRHSRSMAAMWPRYHLTQPKLALIHMTLGFVGMQSEQTAGLWRFAQRLKSLSGQKCTPEFKSFTTTSKRLTCEYVRLELKTSQTSQEIRDAGSTDHCQGKMKVRANLRGTVWFASNKAVVKTVAHIFQVHITSSCPWNPDMQLQILVLSLMDINCDWPLASFQCPIPPF